MQDLLNKEVEVVVKEETLADKEMIQLIFYTSETLIMKGHKKTWKSYSKTMNQKVLSFLQTDKLDKAEDLDL